MKEVLQKPKKVLNNYILKTKAAPLTEQGRFCFFVNAFYSYWMRIDSGSPVSFGSENGPVPFFQTLCVECGFEHEQVCSHHRSACMYRYCDRQLSQSYIKSLSHNAHWKALDNHAGSYAEPHKIG